MMRDPCLAEVVNKELNEDEASHFPPSNPRAGGNVNEKTLEIRWSRYTQMLNYIQEMIAKASQNTQEPIYILSGDGDCARRKAPQRQNASGKKPDLAGYEGIQKGEEINIDFDPSVISNRIPGDAKQYRNIRRAMMPPNGPEYLSPITAQKSNTESIKVLSQIHDYMDQHEARYGYIVNNEELIFFQRRGTGWGHVDISPAIGHKVQAQWQKGILNSMFVLLYFHKVIANDDALWRLESCWNLIPKRRSTRISNRSLRSPSRSPVSAPSDLSLAEGGPVLVISRPKKKQTRAERPRGK